LIQMAEQKLQAKWILIELQFLMYYNCVSNKLYLCSVKYLWVHLLVLSDSLITTLAIMIYVDMVYVIRHAKKYDYYETMLSIFMHLFYDWGLYPC
jgi:hypothetical protein